MTNNHRTLDYVNALSWAIVPEVLATIHDILYKRYVLGGVNIAEVEQQIGHTLNNAPIAPNVSGSVAIISIYGVIAKRMNMFTQISGGVSTELLKQTIQTAVEDPAVDAIVLDIESPGGTVDGTKELADYIYSVRDAKPIVAYANGLMASAALWIGTAASSVIAFDTSSVGSIGVITEHVDYSVMDSQAGVKRTYIYSGKYKAMGNDAEPLTAEAKDYIQSQLNDIYTLFVNDVARNRGLNIIDMNKWADGKMFIAKDAQSVGLVDAVGTISDAVALATDMAKTKEQASNVVAIGSRVRNLSVKFDDLKRQAMLYQITGGDGCKQASHNI